MEYEYLTDDQKLEHLEAQLRELELSYFSLELAKPSQLVDATVYQQWNNQRQMVETALIRLREIRDDKLYLKGLDDES